jgi:hypothetical protein
MEYTVIDGRMYLMADASYKEVFAIPKVSKSKVVKEQPEQPRKMIVNEVPLFSDQRYYNSDKLELFDKPKRKSVRAILKSRRLKNRIEDALLIASTFIVGIAVGVVASII